MERSPAEEPVAESREIVEGRSAATPFVLLSGVGLVVLGFCALLVVALFLIVWLL